MTGTYDEAMTHEVPGGHLSVDGSKPATKAGVAGWAIYDWALNPYFILINIFVFAPYFSSTVIGDPIKGQATWGYVQAAAGVSIALLSPFFGSLADAAGPRKPGIFVFSILATLGMFGLWFAVPGDPTVVILVAACIVVAATNLEFAIVYHNAMLPSIVTKRRMGFVSGIGIATGYLGAILAFIVWLNLFGLPDIPAFGFDKAAHEHNRIVGPIAAMWMWVFALPFFFLTPDQPRTGRGRMEAARHGFNMVVETAKKLPHYKNIAIYLVARMVYYDGQSAVFIFTGVYAAGIFGWETTQIGIYGLFIIIAQVPSSIAGGWIDDKIGSKATIMIAVGAFALGLFALVGTTETTAVYLFDVNGETIVPATAVGGMLNAAGFDTMPERVFMLLGILTGLFAGPSISSSRTMLARIAPPSMMAEFFGLYALCGKATSFLAPFTVAVVTAATQSQRVGLASVLVYILGGLALLVFVREEQGVAHAVHD